jgi:hypothetical protein
MLFQISDNSFVVPAGTNLLCPSTKVVVEMTDGKIRATTLFNGLDTLDYLDGQTKQPTTPTSDFDKESSNGSGSNGSENMNSILNRPDIPGNSTVPSNFETSTQIDGFGPEATPTLWPDPSPRIGTSTKIDANGTEVFPAYTVFGEPCKGNITIYNEAQTKTMCKVLSTRNLRWSIAR